jgi:E3 ubiquitin-protein ligase DOA10
MESRAKRLMTKIKDGKVKKEGNNSEGWTCIVCFEEFNEGDKAKILNCNKKGLNYYHESCILEWLKKKPECPMCRGDVDVGHG